jgi:hypothetical protein
MNEWAWAFWGIAFGLLWGSVLTRRECMKDIKELGNEFTRLNAEVEAYIKQKGGGRSELEAAEYSE